MMNNMDDDFGLDLMGYPFNRKYPPDTERYGFRYHGYKNDACETFFYNFAVQGYDLQFRYKDKMYYALHGGDRVSVTDEHFTEEYQIFKNGNELMENWTIDGKRLIDIIDDCEDVEAM